MDNGDGTVTDGLTGLMWTQDANLMATRDPSFDNDGIAGNGRVTWQHALDYVAKLNSEKYLGYDDWRLPNQRELRSLVDFQQYCYALPPGHPFTNIDAAAYHWSSTSVASDPSYAWAMSTDGGNANIISKASSIYPFVWPVRTGQAGASTTTTTAAGTTTTVPGAKTSIMSSTTTTAAVVSTTTTAGVNSTTTTVPVGITTTTAPDASTTTTTAAAESTTTTTASESTTTTMACPATQALGPGNPKLDKLRDFRDSGLARSAVGREVIRIYYSNAGSITAALERSPALRAVVRRALEALAPMVAQKR